MPRLPTIQLTGLPSAVLRLTVPTGAAVPKLVVAGGPNIAGLALVFKGMLQKACDEQDFTMILNPNRAFQISEDGTARSRSVLSLGAGIEREVLQTLFESYRAQSNLYFSPRADDRCTVMTIRDMEAARFVPQNRLQDLAVFGALSALLLTHGIAPQPLNPVVLHYFIYDCNLHSIHPALCAEWHPELRALIDRWSSLGPNDDISEFNAHFLSYHGDRHISCIAVRDEESHRALAAEMLHRATVGAGSRDHPEIQAFLSGFRLPCRNGFTFCDVPKAFSGGPEAFWSLVWDAHISSFEKLHDHLAFETSPTGMCTALAHALGVDSITPQELLLDFLSGQGIPLRDRYDEAKEAFDPLVRPQLEFIDQPGFRARMFTWATSGTTSLLERQKIKVRFVTEGHSEYGADHRTSTVMCNLGKFSIRTCLYQLLIPFPYLLNLANNPHPRTEIDNWFLLEILNAIGGHSML